MGWDDMLSMQYLPEWYTDPYPDNDQDAIEDLAILPDFGWAPVGKVTYLFICSFVCLQTAYEFFFFLKILFKAYSCTS